MFQLFALPSTALLIKQLLLKNACSAQPLLQTVCEACNECPFYFLASLVKNLLVKTVFASYYFQSQPPIVS